MIVRCKTISLHDIASDYRMPTGMYGRGRATVEALTVGKLYAVYAMHFLQAQIYYYVCTDDYRDYPPLHYPMHQGAPLFDIVSGVVSRSWALSDAGKFGVYLAPKEWLGSDGFFDRLTDGDDAEVIRKWRAIKSRIDDEAASEMPMT